MNEDSTAQAQRLRSGLVLLLTINTGATDALGFIGLGGAFTSVMTGNMVLLGLAGGTVDGTLALLSGGSIACYIAGTALGSRIVGHKLSTDPVWPSRITVALTLQLLIVIAFTISWCVAGGRPEGTLALLLLMANATAIGIQAASVQAFAVPGLSTTFLTGTLTTVVTHLTHRRPLRVIRRSLALLLGLTGGAAVGGALTHYAPLFAPAPQLATLGAVIVIAYWKFR